jgi:hypothetical protein
MEAIHSSETSVLTRPTQRNSPKDGNILSENLEFYTDLMCSLKYYRHEVEVKAQLAGLWRPNDKFRLGPGYSDRGFRSCPQSMQENPRIEPRLSDHRFLPNPL